MLGEVDDLRGVADTAVRQLGDVYQSVLVDADINKSSEGGDVGHYPGQNHALLEILNSRDVLVEFEDFELGSWVKSRLVEFFHDGLERG